MKKIEKALAYATEKHEGQFRDDGVTPYIKHPIEVVRIIEEEFDIHNENLLIAAYVHDVMEDCDVTYDELFLEYGRTVAETVKLVSHTKEQDKIPFYKMYYLAEIATYPNIWAAILKTADRIANTRDFIASGKTRYAKKYFHKGDCIYSRFYMEKYPDLDFTKLIQVIEETDRLVFKLNKT